MPEYHFGFAQGSDDWLAARLGIPTASEFDRIVTPKKLQLAETASVTYMHKLLAEWMYGAPLEAFDGGWVKRGKELEPEAARYYEMEKDVETQAVGFVTLDDGTAGASPDRLVGDVALVEFKCPALETHVGYMLDPQSLLVEYRIQHQGQLWVCSDREYVDMVSYYPGFPAVIVRTYRDELVQRALSTHVPAFVATMQSCQVALVQRYGELRRERTTAEQRTAASHAAFAEFMESGIGGAV